MTRFTFIGPYLVPLPPIARRLLVSEIQAKVASYYRIPRDEMTSDRRSRSVARPRQVAMYLSKSLTPRSLPAIGQQFGGRDHTTVIHAVRQIEKLRREDPQMDQDVIALKSMLRAA